MFNARLFKLSIPILCLGMSACASVAPHAEYVITPSYILTEGVSKAPFGGEVSSDILNYTRAAPNVGTAGKLVGNGVAEAQQLGFKLIIDLRRPDEGGVAEEIAEASRLGIAYENVPLAKDATAWDQVERIEALIADRSNYPVLIHCGSANRAGAVWALYRTRQGVPNLIAIEEGRTVGLKSREVQVRELLGLPAL
ncbi:MAG: sulfur transferase domain-containing protein [Pseudomonadota bacterium]